MKYEVTMSCGHTETIQLFGKTADRERRIEWLERYGLCEECKKEKAAEEMTTCPMRKKRWKKAMGTRGQRLGTIGSSDRQKLLSGLTTETCRSERLSESGCATIR